MKADTAVLAIIAAVTAFLVVVGNHYRGEQSIVVAGITAAHANATTITTITTTIEIARVIVPKQMLHRIIHFPFDLRFIQSERIEGKSSIDIIQIE